MPDYSLPIYDAPRAWINNSRIHGLEWDAITKANKINNEGLEAFLSNQMDMNC